MGAMAEQKRVHDEAKHIDQSRFEEHTVEDSCSVLHDVLAGLLLDLANLFGNIALNDDRIPGSLLERGRSNELRDAVHALDELHWRAFAGLSHADVGLG